MVMVFFGVMMLLDGVVCFLDFGVEDVIYDEVNG